MTQESNDHHDFGKSRYRRSPAKGASFFFTVNAYQRRPVLTHPDVRAALRAAIVEVRRTLPFRIDAWILLPDHLHAIRTLPENDAVKHELVTRAVDWPYSTFHRYVKRGILPTDWAIDPGGLIGEAGE